MQFEEQYPNKPPGVKFVSTMFHPNVYGTGELCLDILQNRWSPTYDVAAILTSIQSLLNDPNTSSPANVEASNLYKDNRREYTKRVRETVEKENAAQDIMIILDKQYIVFANKILPPEKQQCPGTGHK